MSYELVAGDLGTMPLVAKLNNVPADLSEADTVELHWVMPDGSLRISSLTAVNPAVGQYFMTWQSGDTDQVGAHFGHIVAVTDSIQETYPSDGSRIIWFVNPSIAEY